METLNNAQSKLVFTFSLLSAAVAISFAFHAQGSAIKPTLNPTLNPTPVLAIMTAPNVVIVGKKMTNEEKLVYDLAPQEIARVEIIGKRLTAEEKLALTDEDDRATAHATYNRKA